MRILPPQPARSAAARLLLTALAFLSLLACADRERTEKVVTFPGSAVGAEAELLGRQLERFTQEHPGIRVERQTTPDAADHRHQLYVQWLNAGASDPDILQLDVIWTPEFAAAGWILPLERFGPETGLFFPAAIEANSWRGRLHALPWFIDVGMLYWRTDLLDRAPSSLAELSHQAREAVGRSGTPYGFVWQGSRYEGLVCVFLEMLGAFGGEIVDRNGRIVVDGGPAVEALTWMKNSIYDDGLTPESVLTWQEEQTRFAFQNGEAVFMRNWPYAGALLADPDTSRVAGSFAVAPMPATEGGSSHATLGGSQLAINARTDEPEASWKVIEYLTRPEQMLERARVAGQYPARVDLYEDDALARALPIPPGEARRVIERAAPRPVTPVYTQLSELLQIRLHRALTGQEEPAAALHAAAEEMRAVLRKTGLGPDDDNS